MAKRRSDYAGKPTKVSYDVAQAFLRTYPDCVFVDLVPHTLEELLGVLAPGSVLRKKAEEEQLMVTECYGEFFVYPETAVRRLTVTRFARACWHRIALLASNSTLLMDPAMKDAWADTAEKLRNAVVGVVGCSVGNGVAHAVARNLRPHAMKIADPKAYHLTNANRVTIDFDAIGCNKAVVTASQIHGIDPFVNIDVYDDGVQENSVDEFLCGMHVLVDECDSLDMKILLRERSRAKRIPVVMVTDMGSAAQVDVRRFDRNPNATLTSGNVPDAVLYAARDACKTAPTRANFYNFVRAIVGCNESHIPEYKRILDGNAEQLFTGVPQLGSTVMAGGGFAAEIVSRIILGHEVPERMFAHLSRGTAVVEWRSL